MGGITRSRPSVPYRLGLVVVALLMVLLPAVYVALVLLVGWGVWLHATNDTGLLKHGVWIGLTLYGGPLVVGCTLVLFMVKPLFAKGPTPPPAMSLDDREEPLLFAFIARICEIVAAPRPRRVEVNCVVNASASFRRGIPSFLGPDLTLTIGLPLVAGLSMRQFAGVLAHEFGHFGQGAGMRLTYLIRRINYWFSRVVYQRDKWDVELERAARGSDVRIGIVFEAARGCVWLTRRVLWLLMQAGHAVSCFMLRQMEYDADSYECRVAGSDTFRETMLRIQQLNAGCAAAFAALGASWKARRLPESLPQLIVAESAALPPPSRERTEGDASEPRTRAFDTHPCDADRVRAAVELAAPGVFRSTDMATALFRDFGALDRRVTRFCYEKEHGLQVSAENLVEIGLYLRESRAAQAAQSLFARYFGGVATTHRPVSISAAETLPAADPEVDVARLRSARDRMRAVVAAAQGAEEIQERIEDRLIKASKAVALARAGFSFSSEAFEIESATRAAAVQAINRLEEQRREGGRPLEEFSFCARERLSAALRLLNGPTGAVRLADAMLLREEASRLLEALGAVAQATPALLQLGRTWSACQVLLASRPNHAQPAQVDRVLQDLAGHVRGLLKQVTAGFGAVSYPFPHARGAITLAEFVRPDEPAPNELIAVMNEGHACLDRLFPLYQELLSRLARIATLVEESLAPEAAPGTSATPDAEPIVALRGE